jgi:hypothetical protein
VVLRDGFAKICATNSIVKRAWPEEGIIDLIVRRSCGQFVYAVTVGADFCSPIKQFELILTCKSDSAAFSDLDQLYTQMLSVHPSTVNICQVLGILVGDHLDLTLEVVEDLLEMEKGELKPVLRGLSSLMMMGTRIPWLRKSSRVSGCLTIYMHHLRII